MARRRKKEALAVFGLGELAKGFRSGLDSGFNLQDQLAQREIQKQSLKLRQEEKEQARRDKAFDRALKIQQAAKGSTRFVPDATGQLRQQFVPGLPEETSSALIEAQRQINPNIPEFTRSGTRTVGAPPSETLQTVGLVNTPEGRALLSKGSKTGRTVQSPLGQIGPIAPVQEKPLSTQQTKDIGTFTNFKRSQRNVLKSLLADIETGEQGNKRKLKTGFRLTTLDLPGVNIIREQTTSPENIAFFGELRKTQSRELTEATGAARGFREISFLAPATIDPREGDTAILLKGTKNLLINGINLARTRNFLAEQGKITPQLEKDMIVDFETIGKVMDRFEQEGVDTAELQNLVSEYFKNLPKHLQLSLVEEIGGL